MRVHFLEPVKPWENIRFQGEDVKPSAVVVEPGERIGVGHLALLGALGINQVAAIRRPRVGLLATGSELREAGQPLGPGQIYESNRLALAALVTQAGGVPKLFPLVSDTPDATRTALAEAFSDCDVVVTSGGVSVGELDFVKSAFQELGGKLEFWRVAIKPGKPFVFGRWKDKCLFGLPGNPVSALVTFLLLARPALRRLQGAGETGLPAHPGVLAEALVNPGGRRHFIRAGVHPSAQSCARERKTVTRCEAHVRDVAEIRLAKQLLLSRPGATCKGYGSGRSQHHPSCAGIGDGRLHHDQTSRSGKAEHL